MTSATFDCSVRHSPTCTIVALALAILTSVSVHAQQEKPDNGGAVLTGTLVDDAGNPIAGANLTVVGVWKLERGNRDRAPGGGSGVSDAQGHVTIEGLPRGRILSLRFAHPHFPRYWFEATTVKDPAIARKTTRGEIVASGFRKTFARPQRVQVRLVGNDGKSPLPGVIIEARPTSDSDQVHFDNEWSARARTDPEGFAAFALSQGAYELSLGEDRPLDCIALNEPRIGVRDAEHLQTYLRMTRRGADVVFKAVDADTGRPIAGVSFWRENPLGEYWFEIVRNENIGWAAEKGRPAAAQVEPSRETEEPARGDDREVGDEEGRKPPYLTDDAGLYRCQMRPSRGWTYHVHHMPEGYEDVDPTGQTFDIPSEGGLEKTFVLRKRAKR